MKVLITPIGIYIGRVIKGIATIKPDMIYLCVQEPVEVKDEYLSNLYKKWNLSTKKHAKKIMKKLDFLYDKDKIKILKLDIRNDNYLPIYKDLLKLILSLDPNDEVYIDTTSTTFPFRVAAITLSIFLKNVNFIYTPSEKPLAPKEYKKEVIEDDGLPPRIIPVPQVDFSEIQTGILKDILVVINSKFDGEVPSVSRLLSALGMEKNKGNMIKMSKLLKKLERYGCVSTKKRGRVKEVKLTMIGSSIAEVLKEV